MRSLGWLICSAPAILPSADCALTSAPINAMCFWSGVICATTARIRGDCCAIRSPAAGSQVWKMRCASCNSSRCTMPCGVWWIRRSQRHWQIAFPGPMALQPRPAFSLCSRPPGIALAFFWQKPSVTFPVAPAGLPAWRRSKSGVEPARPRNKFLLSG